jgi:hypothetical protein
MKKSRSNYAFAASLLLPMVLSSAAVAQALPDAEPEAASAAQSPANQPNQANQAEIEAAADTVAEVAAMSPSTAELDAAADTVSAVATGPTAETSADADAALDAELEALGLNAETGVTDNALRIYGFASATFMGTLSAGRQAVNQFLAKETTFLVTDLNLYFAKKITDQWRSMVELRLTYAPNGRVLTDGGIEPNQSYDQGLLGRNASWGGINIERAHLEYDIHPNTTIQAGSFLTPYGIWNVDHGAPAIIPFVRPYVLSEQLFPERQAGLHVFGRIAFGDYLLGYHATLSNGRGYFDQFRDLDQTKALGARLQFETPWLGGLRFGASAYHGRFVDRDSDFLAPNPQTKRIDNVTPTGVRYDELALAGDILYDVGGLHVQAELVGRNFSYLNEAREPDGAGFRPDSYSLGGYVLVGYRFQALWNVMPYAFYQRYKREESSRTATFSALENYQVGLNFRPTSELVLKVQFGQSWIPGGNPPVDKDLLSAFGTQAAWVF